MAEIKNQRPRRKFGLGDLFVLVLLVIVVVGIIIGATQTNSKVENLSYIELTDKMEEGLIVNIQAQGVKGDGNDKIVYVVGKFVETYELLICYAKFLYFRQQTPHQRLCLISTFRHTFRLLNIPLIH